MAYGQNQVFIASPQPGTSNQPYPVGRSPAFVPVNATVTNDYAANIEAESLVLSALIASLMTQLGNGVTPMTIAGVLSGVNDSLTRMADTKIAMAKALANLSIAVAANSVAISAHTSTTSTLGGSDLEKNNFYKATSPDTPVMPTVTEQLKVSVTNGGLLQTAGRAANIASSFIISSISKVGSWITGSKPYQSVVNWLSDTVDIISATITSSARSLLAKIKGGF
jgi:hypothetical protein